MARRRRHYQRNSGHGGGMGSIVGIAAIGIGGYLLWQWLTSSTSTAATPIAAATPVSTVPTSTSSNVAVVPTSTTSNAVSPTAAVATPAVVIPQAAPSNGMVNPPVGSVTPLYSILEQTAGVAPDTLMTADQWSYYYQQLRGIVISPSQYQVILNNLNNQFPGNNITNSSMMTATEFVQGLTTVGLSGMGRTATQTLNPVAGNQATVQNAPYGSSPVPGRPFREQHPVFGSPMGMPVITGNGMGRTYLSGYAGRGMGIIGQGYGINETTFGNATKYELATKYVM